MERPYTQFNVNWHLLFLCLAFIGHSHNSYGQISPPPNLDLSGDCQSLGPVPPQLALNLWYQNVTLNLETQAAAICDSFTVTSVPDEASLVVPADSAFCFLRRVEWTVTDTCGGVFVFNGSFEIFQSAGPELQGIPNDTTIECDAALPPVNLVQVPYCSGIDTIIFDSSSTQGSVGCTPYTYEITRFWQIIDSCGFQNTYSQTVSVVDTANPTFTVPADVLISCTDDPNDLGLTGSVGDLMDNCDGNPQLSFLDVPTPGPCPQSFTIQRFWVAVDACGNEFNPSPQRIVIVDNEAPSFTVPADTSVSCDEFAMGFPPPSDLADNCDTNPILTFSDNISTDPNCPFDQIILRTWTATDACGNVNAQIQTITVTDTLAPAFLTIPMDTIFECSMGQDLDVVFQNWIDQNLVGNVVDNCTDSSNLVLQALDTLGGQAILPPAVCPSPDSPIVRSQTVKFLIADECGNIDSAQARFVVLDTTPPVFASCPTDSIVGMDPDSCNVVLDLFPPEIIENCGVFLTDEIVSLDVPVTGPPDNLIPVDPVILDFPLAVGPPVNALSDGALRIDLEDMNANEPGQFFNIFGEDGSLLDTTIHTPIQCSDTSMMVVLTRDQLNTWGADGVISIRMEADTTGAKVISNICGTSRVRADLMFQNEDQSSIAYAYRINNGPKVIASLDTVPQIPLDSGSHVVAFFIEDCAGNADSCSVNLEVADLQPPTIVCPNDTIIESFDSTSCDATFTLAKPQLPITDNCSPNIETVVYWFEGPLLPPSPRDSFDVNGATPTINLRVGRNLIYYEVRDGAGNRDTCTYAVQVNDKAPPTVLCYSDSIFTATVSPGTLSIPIDVEDLLPGGLSFPGFDNCGILDTVFADPDQVECTLVGIDTLRVGVIGIDLGQNRDTCFVRYALTPIPPVPSANDSLLCEGDSLLLFANPPPADSGVTYLFSWTGPNGYTSTEENPIIPFPDTGSTGTYTVEVSNDSLGCGQTGSVTVNIIPFAPAPNLTGPMSVCQGDNIVLSTDSVPSGTFLYQWYEGIPLTGTLIGTGTDSFFVVTPPNVDTVNYYLTILQNACESAPSNVVTVTVGMKPVAVVDTNLITACPRDVFQLGTPVAGPGITYLWTGPNGFISTMQFPMPIIASDTTAGQYTLVVSLNGCPSDPAFVDVIVAPDQGKPLAVSNSPFCEGDSLQLSTPATGDIYWWFTPAGDTIMTASNPLAIGVTQADTGFYQLQVVNSGCISEISDSIAVEVNENPVLAVSATDTTICSGETIQLFANPTIPGGTYSWLFPDGSVINTQNPIIGSVSPLNGGLYTATVIDSNGCQASDTLTIKVLNQPVIDAIDSNNPGCDSITASITLSAQLTPPDGGGNYLYEWTSTEFGIETTPTVTFDLDPGDTAFVLLTVTDTLGCASETDSTLQILNLIPPQPDTPTINPIQPVDGFCAGDTVRLQTVPPGFGVDVRYLWTTPSGVDTTFMPELIFTDLSVGDAGSYTVSYWVDGCESLASGSISLTVKDRPSVTTVSNSPVCEGDTLTLFAFPNPAGATGSWTGPNGVIAGDTVIIPNADPLTDAGLYIYVAGFDGCTSVPDTQVVDVPALPGPQTAFNDGPVCGIFDSAFVTLFVDSLSAPGNATFIWFGPAGTEVGRTMNFQFIFTDLASLSPGPNDFFVIADVNGCQGPPSNITQVVVEAAPDDEQAFAGVDQTLCSGELVQLDAFPPTTSTGFWRELSGAPEVRIIAPSNPKTPVDGLISGQVYEFEWSLSSGICVGFSSDTVRIDLNGGQIADAGPNQVICPDSTIRLNALPPIEGSGEWSQSSEQIVAGVVIVDPDDPGSEVIGLETGTTYLFTWTVTTACGISTANTTLALYNSTPEAGDDLVVCSDAPSVQLNATPLGAGNLGVWSSLDPAITFSDVNDPRATAFNLSDGQNVLRWTNIGGGCPVLASDSVVVSYSVNPIARPDTASVAFQGEVVIRPLDNDFAPPGSTFSLLDQPSKGSVEQLDSFTILYRAAPNEVGTDQLSYELCAEGCECSIGTISIEIGEDLGGSDADTCSVPNIITPNGDGINDFFVIPCLRLKDNFPNNQVTIYNRYGDEVFKAAPYDDGGDPTKLWGGTFNGSELPAGTYFYLVDFGDGSKTKSGWVYLTK